MLGTRWAVKLACLETGVPFDPAARYRNSSQEKNYTRKDNRSNVVLKEKPKCFRMLVKLCSD